MALPLHTLDVFTDRRFGGNPLAVVSDADALTDDAMQAIAREMNLSETVFLLKPQNPAHSARMRMFTPSRELPFAGHPTIGTAILLAQLHAQVVNGERDAIIVLEQAIGTVRVGVRLRANQPPFAEFDAPKLPEKSAIPPSRDRIADALGLLPREIGFENHTPQCVSAGSTFAFIPVAGLEAIARARVEPAHWANVFPGASIGGVYLYARECVHNGAAFHARMFAPQLGVAEDPATGSAAVCLAGVINDFDGLPDGTHRRLIEQGHEMGRPSTIALTLVVANGRLETVRIGGSAVRVIEGLIATEPRPTCWA
ncbi:MAG: PhzF family phenazine biosynthesis protein [Hyphomicrobium sp.]|jgi:trans-2,3-dihydro-3-hydroxyanthranilate isomerase